MATEKAKPPADSPAGTATDIETLKREHARLDQERRNAQANLNAAQNQLDQLRTDARKEYGTEDLDQLREKLRQMREENERKRSEYQAHLEQVRAKLAEVEQSFAGAGQAKGKENEK